MTLWIGAAVVALAAIVFRLAVLLVRRARAAPPRHANPNSIDYFSDENFPLVADRELGVWNRPSHHFVKHTDFGGDARLRTEVWFDRDGIRVAGPGVETPPQVDVLVVGESNTWGQGTAYDSTYSSVLGGLLGMTSANLGLIASSGVQDLLVARRFISRQPKLLVYGLWEEQFFSNIRRCPNIDSPVCLARPIVKRGRGGAMGISLPMAVGRNLRDYRRWYLTAGPGASPSLASDSFWTARILLKEFLERRFPTLERVGGSWRQLARTDHWPLALAAMQFVLSEMQRVAESVDAKLIVAYMPYYFDEVAPPPPELSAFVREHGIALVSLHKRWDERKRAGSTFLHPVDGHLDGTGHRDVAEAVAAKFRAVAGA